MIARIHFAAYCIMFSSLQFVAACVQFCVLPLLHLRSLLVSVLCVCDLLLLSGAFTVVALAKKNAAAALLSKPVPTDLLNFRTSTLYNDNRARTTQTAARYKHAVGRPATFFASAGKR